jgi:glycine/D-amino acid oxidase-like deaminating enzyme
LFSSYDFGTVQTRRGNLLLGQMSYFTPPFSSRASFQVMPGSARESLRIFPQIKKARILRAWRSPAPFTPDHLPLVGHLMGYDNGFVASGFQSAITSCYWAGEHVAQLAGGGRLPEQAKIFDPGRFLGGRT